MVFFQKKKVNKLVLNKLVNILIIMVIFLVALL